MMESERITALETKVEALECRMTKLESADEMRAQSFAGIDTKLQLLGQKFDTFVESLAKATDNKKFNWTQIIVIAGIVLAMMTTIWATNYTIKETLKTTSFSTVNMSQEDLNDLKENMLKVMKEVE